jgi:hypothetical protein
MEFGRYVLLVVRGLDCIVSGQVFTDGSIVELRIPAQAAR